MDSSESTSRFLSLDFLYFYYELSFFNQGSLYTSNSLCRGLLSSSAFAFKTLLMKMHNQMVLTIFDLP